MAIISDTRSDIKTASLGSRDIKPYKELSAENIISDMSFNVVMDPIDPKRISKEPTRCLNASSVVKTGLVFLGTVGAYYLAKTTNILSYFGWGAKNLDSKNVGSGEIAKIKRGENALTVRRNLKAARQANSQFVNRIAQMKDGDGTVKFKEIEVEGLKSFQKANVKRRHSFNRRSINVQNPIPDQSIIIGKSFNLTIDGNSVFNSSSSLSFLDAINIPAWLTSYCNPKLIGYCDTPGGSILLADNYAYVSAGRSGLQIIDIINPINPTFKGSYNTSGSAGGVDLLGNYAYMVDYNLQIVDISDPSNPTFKGFYGIPGNAGGIKISGNYAYIAAWKSGLHILDISNSSNPILKGSYITPKGVRGGIAVSGNYAYIIDSHPNSLHIVDISDPSNPTFKGSYNGINDASIVTLSGNYVYIDDSYPSRLKIIDISDPSNPNPMGEYNIPGLVSGIAIFGNYAYVAGGHYHRGDSGLFIADVSDPANPVFKGSYDTPHIAFGVALSGNYAYVTNGGLQIVDPNLDKLTLSGTPISIGTYSVDITACNGIMECVTDSFNIIVSVDLTTLIIVGSIIGGICTVSFCLPLIVVVGVVMLRRHRNKLSRSIEEQKNPTEVNENVGLVYYPN